MSNWVDQRWQVGATVLEPGKGGIARVARMTAKALIEAGAKTDILAYLDQDTTEIVETRSKTAKGSKLKFAAGLHLAAMHHDWFLFDSAGPARARAQLPGLCRPYGVWMHGIEAWEGLTPGRAEAFRNANFVLVNSHHTLNRFQKLHGPLKRAHVCQLATEADEKPSTQIAFSGPPSVLILGRIDADEMYKGHQQLIECWPEIVAKVPNARLLIAGSGTGLEQIRDLARRSAVSEQIELLGYVPEDQMDQLWQRAHVMAMPSLGEGFGLTYIEAMRHGLPVVASRQDAGQEVNVDGITGFNIDQSDLSTLAEKLSLLLSNLDLTRKFGQAGQRHWQSNYRYSLFAERLRNKLEILCVE